MLDELDKIRTAPRSPRFETIEEARGTFPRLTLDEYALARVVNSEHDSGSAVEMACIADAVVNAAGRRSLFDHATRGNGFGGQGRDRPVASGRAPGPRHVLVALGVLRAPHIFGLPVPLLKPPLRGISRGATRFLNVKTQTDQADKSPATHCPPAVILKRWTYSLPWGPDRCTLGTKRGSGQLEWVGPIAGVDAYAGVMLLRPATSAQDRLFADALKVIETRGKHKGRFPLDPGGAALVALLVGASVLAAHGGIG